MEKFLNLKDKRLKKIVDLVGDKTSLNEGLNLAKGLIANYFREDIRAESIINLIDIAESENNA